MDGTILFTYRLTIDQSGCPIQHWVRESMRPLHAIQSTPNLMKHYRGRPNIPTSVLYAVMIIILPIVSCPQMIVTSVVAALTNRLPTGHLGDNFGGGPVRIGHQPLS